MKKKYTGKKDYNENHRMNTEKERRFTCLLHTFLYILRCFLLQTLLYTPEQNHKCNGMDNPSDQPT